MDEDNIRPPDEAFNEQLIEDNRDDFEKQVDEAIIISKQEMDQQCDINRKYEEQLLKDYASETSRRSELFKDFLFNLKKISNFDKETGEIYNILDPIIDSYCNQCIQTCELDSETHDKIFNILKKIRNNTLVLDTLKTIILK